MRTGEVFLVVYSITSRGSLESAEAMINQIMRIKDYGLDDMAAVLFGNKCDLEVF